ncbi:unnamed protein product, partial [Rotaria sordida]
NITILVQQDKSTSDVDQCTIVAGNDEKQNKNQ